MSESDVDGLFCPLTECLWTYGGAVSALWHRDTARRLHESLFALLPPLPAAQMIPEQIMRCWVTRVLR